MNKTELERKMAVFVGIIFAIGLYYLVISIIYFGICWAFDFDFSWKGAFGILLAAILINILTKKP